MRYLAFFIAVLMASGGLSRSARSVETLPPALLARIQALHTDFVAVSVWSPFCEPCGDEVGALNQALQIAGPSGRLAVIGIPVRSRKREIDAFISHFGPKFDQWYP